jgi:hypothetical protein
LPPHAPPEYADRQTLWNAVEKAELYPQAQSAYSFDIAFFGNPCSRIGYRGLLFYRLFESIHIDDTAFCGYVSFCVVRGLADNVLDKRLKISYAIARHKLPDNGKRNEPLFPGGMGRAAKEGTESWKNF